MDITDDVLHSTMLRVCREAGAPDYVLESGAMDKEAASKLPDALFADRVNRRYPIDSKANTWLSAAYFAKTAGDDHYATKTMKDYVESSIKLAADKYGIRKDVDEAMSKLRAKPAEKMASDDESNYGWPSEKKYPMFDGRGVKMANDYFAENCYNYPAAMRKEIAKRIFQKSAEYGIKANDVVRRESGNGFNLMEDVGVDLMDRVRAAGRSEPELAGALAKAAAAALSLPAKEYAKGMDKLAGMLDQMDEALGFADQYGRRFRSPMEIFHGRDIKEAQAVLDDSVQLGDNLFSITKLAGLPMDLFTSALGDDFGDMIRGGSGKAMRITKKIPGGMMRITISGGSMPDLMDGGFGFDTDKPEMPCGSEGCDDPECPVHGDKVESEKPEDVEDVEDGGDADVIDVKKLGKALKALPERDRNALRKAIEMYMD